MDAKTVLCPVCNGVCGVNVADPGEVEDWHDCDFCNATGEVPAQLLRSCHSSVDSLACGYWRIIPIMLESGDTIAFPIWQRNAKPCRFFQMWGFSCCKCCTNHRADKP